MIQRYFLSAQQAEESKIETFGDVATNDTLQ